MDPQKLELMRQIQADPLAAWCVPIQKQTDPHKDFDPALRANLLREIRGNAIAQGKTLEQYLEDELQAALERKAREPPEHPDSPPHLPQ